jgi:hypothetical protein
LLKLLLLFRRTAIITTTWHKRRCQVVHWDAAVSLRDGSACLLYVYYSVKVATCR